MKKTVLIIIGLLAISMLGFAHEHNMEDFDEDLQNLNRRYYFSIGTQTQELTKVNNQMAAKNYSTYSDNLLSIDGGAYIEKDQFIFGFELVGFAGIEKTIGTNEKYNSHFTGGYGMIKLGYDLAKNDSFSFYPSFGFGFGASSISLEDNQEVSFSEVITDPLTYADQGIYINKAHMIFDFGLGIDRLLENSKDDSGLLLGMKAGYLLGVPLGEWQRGTNDNFLPISVPDGPEHSVTGPYVRFTVGFGGNKCPTSHKY